MQDLDDWSARIDFLATYMAEQIDGGLLAKELEALLGCQVGLSKNLEGSDIQVVVLRVGDCVAKFLEGAGFA